MTRVKLFSFMLFLTLFGVLVSIPLHPQGFGKVNQYGLDMQLVNEAFLDLDGDTYNDSIFFAFKTVTAPASTVLTVSVEYKEKGFPYWENWSVQYYNITTDSSGNAWFNTTISANASTWIYVYFGFSDNYGNYDSYYAEYYLDGLYLPYVPPVMFSVTLLNSSTSDTDSDGYADTFSGTFNVVDTEGSNTSFFDVYVYWYGYLGNLWWDSGQWLHIGTGYLNNNSGYFSFSLRFNETATYDLSFYFIDAWNRNNGEYYGNIGRMDGYNTPWVPYDLYWPYPYVEEFNSTGAFTDSVKIRYDYSLSFSTPATVNYAVQVNLYYEENYNSRTFMNGTTQYFTFAGNSSSYYNDFFEIIFPINKSGNYIIETTVWDTDTGIVWANDSSYYWLTYGIQPEQPLVWVSNTSMAIIDADGDNAFDTFVFDVTLYSNTSNLDIPIDIYFDIYTDVPNYGRLWYYNDTYGTLRSPGSLTLRSSFTAEYEGNYTINIYVYEQLEWNTVFNYSTTVYLSPRTVSTSTSSSSSESSLTTTSTLIDNPPADNTTSEEPPANDSVSDTASAPVLPLPIPVLPTLLGLFITGVILKKRKI